MIRIKMHISKVKLPFYPLCEVKCRLQNGVSTYRSLDELPLRRYELRVDFIAINATIHSSATSRGDQWTNPLTRVLDI